MKDEDDRAVAEGKTPPNGFETVILDTADILYSYCEKYICANAKRADGGFGVDSVGEIPYGKGYGLVAKEFDDSLRSIVQMDYGLVIISHATDKTFKDETGQEYNRIVPTLDKRANNIVSRMCDIIAYSRTVTTADGKSATRLFMRGTPRYEAGSRFKYTPDSINFTYKDLVEAIGEAIDKQAAEEGETLFTESRNNMYNTSTELDFDALMTEFNTLVDTLMATEDKAKMSAKIKSVIERHLGHGNTVKDMSIEQVEALSLIVSDLKALQK